MTVSKIALAAALTLGGSSFLLASAADAQRSASGRQQAQQQPAAQGQAGQAQGRQLQFSRAEQQALQPLNAALQAQDWAAAQAVLPAAQAAAQGADAKYFVARAQFQIANRTQNVALENQALDALVALSNVPQEELTLFLNRQAELAFNANDFAKAERAYSRVLELSPNDTRVLQNLSIIRSRQGNTAGSLEALQRTIQTQEAAGQTVSEDSYRRLLGAAIRARQADLIASTTNKLLNAYPNPTNWRDALMLYRQANQSDAQLNIDIYRLQRATRSLTGEADYTLFAEGLNRGGLVGEAKAVLDEGIAARAISTSAQFIRDLNQVVSGRINEDRSGLAAQQRQAQSAANGRLARNVGDALYGYGRYADAAAMYRLALQKGGEDANLINTRLGASLAMAGQRAEAEAAFRAVTGPRQRLANYWLTHLARRAS